MRLENKRIPHNLRVLMSDENKFFLLHSASSQAVENNSALSQQDIINSSTFSVCNNAISIINAAQSIKPDVMLLDFFIGQTDVLYVINTINKCMQEQAPCYVILCDFIAPRLEKELYSLGVSAVLTKPVAFSAIYSLIYGDDYSCYVSSLFPINADKRVDRFENDDEYESAEAQDKCPCEMDMHELEVAVTDIMHQLGVPAHIKGYQYIRFAIMLSVLEPGIINAVTKQLYPLVAQRFQTTSSRVERAIRHAIELAWDRGDVDMLNSYFGYTIQSTRGKPTNSEFVAMISDKLRISMLLNS